MPSRIDAYIFSFFQRTVTDWNALLTQQDSSSVLMLWRKQSINSQTNPKILLLIVAKLCHSISNVCSHIAGYSLKINEMQHSRLTVITSWGWCCAGFLPVWDGINQTQSVLPTSDRKSWDTDTISFGDSLKTVFSLSRSFLGLET